MKVVVEPGKYVVAVSGGIDSMVLLELLAQKPDLELVVAHFDHGIRADSSVDAEFVAAAAKQRGLRFELGQAQLGAGASEADARAARYDFLFDVQARLEADSVITAHHQDDLIETAFINLLRGTGPQGLIAISVNSRVKRPLLPYRRTDIEAYAKAAGVSWQEDATNYQLNYLRNYVRQNIVKRMNHAERELMLAKVAEIEKAQREIDELVILIAPRVMAGGAIDRVSFSNLPNDVGQVMLLKFLRSAGITELDRKTIERLTMAIKTGRPGSIYDIKQGRRLQLEAAKAHLKVN
jgi:tRNA(Ile)-lysidine synthetase-like protein